MSAKTRPETKSTKPIVGLLIELFSKAVVYITESKRSAEIIEQLRKALQLFKNNTLAKVSSKEDVQRREIELRYLRSDLRKQYIKRIEKEGEKEVLAEFIDGLRFGIREAARENDVRTFWHLLQIDLWFSASREAITYFDKKLKDLGLRRSMDLLEFQHIFPVPKPDTRLDNFKGFATLGRSGSGDFLVTPPDYKWFSTMEQLSKFNYGKVTVVVCTELREGYDGYPGCELWFYPGDQVGHQIDEDGKLNLPYRPDQLVEANDRAGAFGLRTAPDDLRRLMEVMGQAAQNSELRQAR